MIKSTRHYFTYVGVTEDMDRRIEEHNNSQVESTRPYAPFKLIYYEAYADKRDAFEREKKLKKYGKAMYDLKNRLRYSLNLVN
jgi:putative endonuclease